jgi:hypothetical protein
MMRRILMPLGVLALALLGFLGMVMLRSPSRPLVDERPPAAATIRHASHPRASDADLPQPKLQDQQTADDDLPPARQRVTPPGPVRIRAGQAIPEIFPYQAERDDVQALVTTYDPSRIPEIARYLGHQDPTVREAARQGLLQLGHSDAIPYLKAALKHASSEESEKLRADIEFLSLPAASIP